MSKPKETLTFADLIAFVVFLVMLAIGLYLFVEALEKEATLSGKVGAAYASGNLSRIEAADVLR